MKLNLNRYFKFLVVGASGTIINFLVFKMIINFTSLNFAWLLGVIAGATSNYVLNEIWTFNDTN